MKKVLSVLLAFSLVLGVALSTPMFASGASVEDITFELNEDGTGYVVADANPGAVGELKIPETYDGGENVVTDSAEPVMYNAANTSYAIEDLQLGQVLSVGDTIEIAGDSDYVICVTDHYAYTEYMLETNGLSAYQAVYDENCEEAPLLSAGSRAEYYAYGDPVSYTLPSLETEVFEGDAESIDTTKHWVCFSSQSTYDEYPAFWVVSPDELDSANSPFKFAANEGVNKGEEIALAADFTSGNAPEGAVTTKYYLNGDYAAGTSVDEATGALTVAADETAENISVFAVAIESGADYAYIASTAVAVTQEETGDSPLDFSSSSTAASGEGWSWDNTNKVLTLSGLNLNVTDSEAQRAIYLPEGATIHLTEGTVNNIVCAGESAISGYNTSVTGTGTLNISVPSGYAFAGAGANYAFDFVSGNINVTESNIAIFCEGNVRFSNVNASFKGTTAGMYTVGLEVYEPSVVTVDAPFVEVISMSEATEMGIINSIVAGSVTGATEEFVTGNTLKLTRSAEDTPIVITGGGAYTPETEGHGAHSDWTPITWVEDSGMNVFEFTESGKYYVTEDVENAVIMPASATGEYDVEICLNGHTLSNQQSVIFIPSADGSCAVKVSNCAETGGIVIDYPESSSDYRLQNAIYSANSGLVELENVNITVENGAAISVESLSAVDSTLGGEVDVNTANLNNCDLFVIFASAINAVDTTFDFNSLNTYANCAIELEAVAADSVLENCVINSPDLACGIAFDAYSTDGDYTLTLKDTTINSNYVGVLLNSDEVKLVGNTDFTNSLYDFAISDNEGEFTNIDVSEWTSEDVLKVLPEAKEELADEFYPMLTAASDALVEKIKPGVGSFLFTSTANGDGTNTISYKPRFIKTQPTISSPTVTYSDAENATVQWYEFVENNKIVTNVAGENNQVPTQIMSNCVDNVWSPSTADASMVQYFVTSVYKDTQVKVTLKNPEDSVNLFALIFQNTTTNQYEPVIISRADLVDNAITINVPFDGEMIPVSGIETDGDCLAEFTIEVSGMMPTKLLEGETSATLSEERATAYSDGISYACVVTWPSYVASYSAYSTRLKIAPPRNITVTQVEGATITASATTAIADDTVSLNYTITDTEVYTFEGWDVKTAGGVTVEVSEDDTFVMPDENVTVTAVLHKDIHAGHADWTPLEWTEGSDGKKTFRITQSGKYYLTEDVDDAEIIHNSHNSNYFYDVEICLNGHTISSTENIASLRGSDSTMKICNCCNEGGFVINAEDTGSSWNRCYAIVAGENTELILEDVKITVNGGDGVDATNAEMYGCTIENASGTTISSVSADETLYVEDCVIDGDIYAATATLCDSEVAAVETSVINATNTTFNYDKDCENYNAIGLYDAEGANSVLDNCVINSEISTEAIDFNMNGGSDLSLTLRDTIVNSPFVSVILRDGTLCLEGSTDFVGAISDIGINVSEATNIGVPPSPKIDISNWDSEDDITVFPEFIDDEHYTDEFHNLLDVATPELAERIKPASGIYNIISVDNEDGTKTVKFKLRFITEQPTLSTPTVTYTDAENSTVQWYKFDTATKVIADVAGENTIAPMETLATYENDVWVPVNANDQFTMYFIVQLYKGAKLKLTLDDPTAPIYGFNVDIYNPYTNQNDFLEVLATDFVDGSCTLDIPYDCYATIISGVMDETQVLPSFTAEVTSIMPVTALEGETNATLSAEKATAYEDYASYAATVTWQSPAGDFSETTSRLLVAPLRDITLATVKGVTITASAEQAIVDSAVELAYELDEGSTFISWDVKTASGEAIEVDYGRFVMPDEDVIVGINIERDVTEVVITIDDTIENGSIATDSFNAESGDTITLIATPAEDYKLYKLEVTDALGNIIPVTQDSEDKSKFTFVAPESNIDITAMFIKEILPVVEIADGAFKDCVYLTSIEIPASVEKIGEEAFAGCVALTEIVVAEGNENYKSVDGVLFNADMTTLIYYPAAKTGESYIIPETVTNIAKGAFDSCLNLEAVFYNGEAEALTVGENNTILEAENFIHYGMTEHKVINGEVTLEPTCSAPGERNLICEYCNKVVGTEEISIDPDAHNVENWEIVKNATCTVAGEKTGVCTICQETVTEEIPATNHPNASIIIAKPATCTQEGYTGDLYCPDCFEIVEKGEKIPVIPHTVTEWNVTLEATCLTDGSRTGACDVCGESQTEVIEALAHKNATLINAKDATCEEDGYTGDLYCPDCSETIEQGEVIAKTGHTVEEWTTTLEPTCTTVGSKTGTCTVCGKTDVVEEIPALGHPGAYIINEKAATCEEAGYTGDTYCPICEQTIATGEETAALGHTVESWTVTTEPTCTEEGVKQGKCTVCGKEDVTAAVPATNHPDAYRVNATPASCGVEGHTGYLFCPDCKKVLEKGEVIPALTHIVDEESWVETTPATCTEEGVMTGICTLCNEEVTKPIPVIAHTEVDGDVITEPTCTEEGVRQIICGVCGEELGTKPIPATNHANCDILDAVAPTCTQPGYTGDKVCKDCYHVEAGTVIPATGHTEGTWITDVAPTCTETGLRHTECTVCGEKLNEEVISANGHSFVDGKCEVCETVEWEYSIVEDVLWITGYNGNDKVLDIPEMLDGTPVTAISKDAFNGGTFSTVIIPETVTTIGENAFANCANLKAISVPETVTTLGVNAFGYTVIVTPGAEGSEPTVEVENVEDFVIYGYTGSMAETYATTYGFTFISVGTAYVVNEEKASEIDDYIVVTENEEGIEDSIIVSDTYTSNIEASYTYKDVVLYGTGSVVTIYDQNDNVVDRRKIVVRGDVNGDGVCDVLDCMLVQLDATENIDLVDEYLVAGDYDENNGITEIDYSGIVNDAIRRLDIVTEPEVTDPEVTDPEVTEPEVTEPEVTEPEVTEPEVTEPEVTDPEVTEPEVTEPEVTEPETTEPAGDE